MEIKATLKKPYNEEQRISFIVEQNHKKGYIIKETDVDLEAWGMTLDEETKAANKREIEQLKAQLNDIDLRTIRALRAKESGIATQEDLNKLTELEEQAEVIRQKINKLGE